MSATKAESVVDAFMEQVRSGLEYRIRSGEVHLDDVDAARRLADSLVAATLTRQERLNDRFGAFYTSERARQALGGISRQALHSRVENKRLLRVTTTDDKKVYPALQFDAEGKLLAGLPRLLNILLTDTADEWVVLYWLTAPLQEFDGRTALEIVQAGDRNALGELVSLATSDAAQWRAVHHEG